MSEDKINDLIADTEIYLDNLSKRSANKLYIEEYTSAHVTNNKQSNSKKNAALPESTDSADSKPENKDSIVLTEKHSEYKTEGIKHKAKSEKDLFGNDVNVKEAWEFAETLEELNEMIHDCSKCRLRETRTKFVFGVGNPNADIVVIGEAPGADEDLKGKPFVGRAGQLLNKILEATGYKREEVYICNIVKNRPPANRNPMPDEVEACKPYLDKQLDLIKPKLVLLLGRVAAETLLKSKEPMNKLRGKVHDYRGYKVMVTYHPAALLRNPNWKKDTWEDMKKLKNLHEEIKSKGKS